MGNLVYVSVNKSFSDEHITLAQLAEQAHSAWPVSLAKAKSCDTLIAVYKGTPVGAWKVLDAYATDETYETNGGPRPRIAFDLGEALPVLPAYGEHPAVENLRRGVATAEWFWKS